MNTKLQDPRKLPTTGFLEYEKQQGKLEDDYASKLQEIQKQFLTRRNTALKELLEWQDVHITEARTQYLANAKFAREKYEGGGNRK